MFKRFIDVGSLVGEPRKKNPGIKNAASPSILKSGNRHRYIEGPPPQLGRLRSTSRYNYAVLLEQVGFPAPAALVCEDIDTTDVSSFPYVKLVELENTPD